MNNIGKGCLILLGGPIGLFFCCGFYGCLNPSNRGPQSVAQNHQPGQVVEQAPKEPKAIVPKKTDQESLDLFMGKLKEAGADRSVVRSARASDGIITITLANGWHVQPYQLRLQVAQNLLRVWATTLDDPGEAWMSLVDINGNEVGGTGFTGVWVQK